MSKKETSKDSDALIFLSTLYNGCTPKSRTNLSSLMQEGLNLAITSGLNFNLDDFGEIVSLGKQGYFSSGWAPSNMERFYSLSCKSRNFSAARSFENMVGREPFMLFKSRRIHQGLDFLWYNKEDNPEVVTCTSFSEDNSHITACSYSERPLEDLSPKEAYQINSDGSLSSSRGFSSRRTPGSKPVHKYIITHKDLSNYRKEVGGKIQDYLLALK